LVAGIERSGTITTVGPSTRAQEPGVDVTVFSRLAPMAAALLLAGCATPDEDANVINRVSIFCGGEEFPSPEAARASKAPGPCSGVVFDINFSEVEKRAVERAGGEDGIALGGMYAFCAANTMEEILDSVVETPGATVKDGIAGALLLCPDSPIAEDMQDYLASP
jgi:hypothetical protein